MKRAPAILQILTAAAVASCSGDAIEIRSIKQPLAEGRQPADVRIGEANAQLALGNVALAIEAYRKALREQPDNVEALMGLATCYDRMGRADLSRRHYEMALAVQPADTAIYSQFAQSLEGQGQRDEAARVKAELAARVVAPEAPREAPGSVPVLPPPPAQSVTVALAPPRSAPVAVERPSGGLRLQRLSMREVALVTAGKPRWESRTVSQTASSATIRFERRAPAPVTLLNAARVQGLAARTRAYLARRGFGDARIGDAPAVRHRSTILFGPAESRRAERLATQFGFVLERQKSATNGLTILLGRDAASEPALKPRA